MSQIKDFDTLTCKIVRTHEKKSILAENEKTFSFQKDISFPLQSAYILRFSP